MVSSVPSIFAKVRYVKTILNMLILLREEGFTDVTVRYVGGDWIYITFETDDLCAKFKKAVGVRSLFSTLRPVVNGFRVMERVVWVEVHGLPCCAWNDVAMKKVVATRGDVCFMEEDDAAPLAVKQVCIKTKISSLIQESLKLLAQGIEYEVSIRELYNWEPEFMTKEASLDHEIPNLSGFESGDDDLSHGSQAGDYDPNNNSDDLENGEMGQDPKNNSDDLQDGEMGQEDSEKTITEKGNKGAGFVDRSGRFFPTNGMKWADYVQDYAQEGAATVEMSTTPAHPASNHDVVHATAAVDMRHQHDSAPATDGCTNGPSQTRNNQKTERGDKHGVNGKRDDGRA
ncbi:hypothetical protein LXL04_010254 [Taraxacum kok-saghyz]